MNGFKFTALDSKYLISMQEPADAATQDVPEGFKDGDLLPDRSDE